MTKTRSTFKSHATKLDSCQIKVFNEQIGKTEEAMFTVFVFARYSHAARFLALFPRRTLITALFAALCQSLVGQMGGMRAGARHIGAAAPFRGHGPVVPGSGGISFRSSRQRPIVVKRFPFRHHLHVNPSFVNACFTIPFLILSFAGTFFSQSDLF
jgi:hypothetical protein